MDAGRVRASRPSSDTAVTKRSILCDDRRSREPHRAQLHASRHRASALEPPPDRKRLARGSTDPFAVSHRAGRLRPALVERRQGRRLSSRLARRAASDRRAARPRGTGGAVGPMPLTMRRSPDGQRLLLSLGGYSEQGVQMHRRDDGRVAAGLAAARGVRRARVLAGRAHAVRVGRQSGRGLPLRLARRHGDAARQHRARARSRRARRARATRRASPSSPDGAHALRRRESRRLAGRDRSRHRRVSCSDSRPSATRTTSRSAPTERVYVSAWGGNTVSMFTPDDGRLAHARRTDRRRRGIRRRSLLERRRLAAVRRVGEHGPRRGRSTRGRARVDRASCSIRRRRARARAARRTRWRSRADGTRLFVAEADDNAVARVRSRPRARRTWPTARGRDSLAGRIPAGWYPTAVLALDDALLVVNGKGRGHARRTRTARSPATEHARSREYTLGSSTARSMRRAARRARRARRSPRFTQRVAAPTAGTAARAAPRYPPFEHVIYVIKENRTYDQVLGDMPAGRRRHVARSSSRARVAEPPRARRALRPVRPLLRERRGERRRPQLVDGGVRDRLPREDRRRRTTPDRGRTYDYEGTNRERRSPTTTTWPSRRAATCGTSPSARGITLPQLRRVRRSPTRDARRAMPPGYRGNKPFLRAHTNPRLSRRSTSSIPDQHRADVWLAELQRSSSQRARCRRSRSCACRTTTPPGARAGRADAARLLRRQRPRARPDDRGAVALAVLEEHGRVRARGRRAERSRSRRLAPLAAARHLAVQPPRRRAPLRQHDRRAAHDRGDPAASTSLSQFDHYGRPLRDIWAATPGPARHTRRSRPRSPLDERNPRGTRGARESREARSRRRGRRRRGRLQPDPLARDQGRQRPYPGARRASAQELR